MNEEYKLNIVVICYLIFLVILILISSYYPDVYELIYYSNDSD